MPVVRRESALVWMWIGWCGIIAHAGSAQRARDSAPLPVSALAVRVSDGTWHTFWSSASAPSVWRDAPLARRVQWKVGAAGVEWGELSLAGTGEAWRTRVIVARFNPANVTLRLDTAFTAAHVQDWSLDRAPPDAVLAVNAGQFEVTMPWGWVVLNGRQWLSPQSGPLAAALAQDSAGRLYWLRGTAVKRFAAARHDVRWAFQSYPVLLAEGVVPEALRRARRGIDVAHRDARAAICLDQQGGVIVVLTRFDAMGESLGFIPFGLTTPEMAGVMGGLGCRDAMLLDGGISAQLRLRDASGRVHDWSGTRKVPLALVAGSSHR